MLFKTLKIAAPLRSSLTDSNAISIMNESATPSPKTNEEQHMMQGIIGKMRRFSRSVSAVNLLSPMDDDAHGLQLESITGVRFHKTAYCRHSRTRGPNELTYRNGCVSNAIVGGLRNALMGVSVKWTVKILKALISLRRPQLYGSHHALLSADTFYFGAFTGSFTFLFRASVCIFRSIIRLCESPIPRPSLHPANPNCEGDY